MKKFELIALFAILIIAFALRLYKIDRPLADWHSWRQADTAAVARNFVKEGYNPFIPRYDDMSSQTNGLDNPNRYRFVEFPLYNSLIAAVWFLFGVNVTSARLVTVFITIGSTVLLYLLVKQLSKTKTALLSAFFFATIPYNVFYSSTILPGPLMVFAILGLYYSFIKWMEKYKNWGWFAMCVIFANIAILAWPIALFFVLPLCYLAYNKFGLNAIRENKLWLLAILSLTPFIAWRFWINQFPEGIPNWRFLINEGNIRFRGAFFRWLIVERLGKLILSSSGFALFIIGIVTNPENREKYFYYSFLASVFLYFTVFASGNVRHDYYQVPIMPVLAVFLAKGTITLFSSRAVNRLVGPSVALTLVVFMFAFGFYEVRGLYWINRPQIITAGVAVDKILPSDATVIAPYNGDTAFLYQTNRHGYPIVDRPLEELIDNGTKYLVSIDVNDPGIQNLVKFCKPIQIAKEYVIVEMFKECIGK